MFGHNEVNKSCPPRILFMEEIPFQNEGKIKGLFSQKLGDLVKVDPHYKRGKGDCLERPLAFSVCHQLEGSVSVIMCST